MIYNDLKQSPLLAKIYWAKHIFFYIEVWSLNLQIVYLHLLFLMYKNSYYGDYIKVATEKWTPNVRLHNGRECIFIFVVIITLKVMPQPSPKRQFYNVIMLSDERCQTNFLTFWVSCANHTWVFNTFGSCDEHRLVIFLWHYPAQ